MSEDKLTLEQHEADFKQLTELVAALPGVDLSIKDGKVLIADKRQLMAAMPGKYSMISGFKEGSGLPDPQSQWEKIVVNGFQLYAEEKPFLYFAGRKTR